MKKWLCKELCELNTGFALIYVNLTLIFLRTETICIKTTKYVPLFVVRKMKS